MASSSLFFLFLFLVLSMQLCFITATTPSNFSSILIFGDSLLDTGNNNFILTLVKGNHPPYGQDFPGGIPTGRFSNGKLVSDLLASALGIKDTVPPFLDPNLASDELKTGVCFASAGSGYDEITSVVTLAIPVSEQTDYFRTSYIKKLKGAVGEEEAKDVIKDSLVLVAAGSNDVVINFYGGPLRRLQFPTIDAYHDFLQTRIQDFVKELYNQGARNMLIAGLPPIGCFLTELNFGGGCLDTLNSDSQSYNQKLVAMLSQLQESLPDSKLVYADFYTPLYDMFFNPQKYGFVAETDISCCGLCTQVSPVCPNPSQYVLWDLVHPAEAAYRVITQYLQETALPHF